MSGSTERFAGAFAALALTAACGGGSTGPTPGPTPPPPPPPPATRVALQPGESRVLTDPAELAAFEIVGGNDAREYQVILMSGSQVEGSTAPLRFRARADASASILPTGARASESGVTRRPRDPFAALSERERRLRRAGHVARLQRMRDVARRLGLQMAPSPRTSVVPASAIPSVGDMITIRSQLTPGGGISCNANTPIDGVVKTVGQTFIIVEDVDVAGHLTDQDYQELDSELDAFVAPVDREFFGDPPDLDGNGRVIAFFTAEVNRAGDAIGFFSPLDMFDTVTCPSSNEGEIVWLIGPDPDGVHSGFDITAEEVKTLSRGLVAHEFQHLLGNFQRFLGGNGPDDVWIDEGLSHLAEEVSGLYRLGLPTRAALGFAETGGAARPVFDDFHLGNFYNAAEYLMEPSATPSLAAFDNPETTASMRGWGYLFLRWLADRYAPATPASLVGGSGDHLFVREVVSGGPAGLVGPDNILRAIQEITGETPSWDEVLAEYFAGPAVADGESVPANVAFRTWDLDRLYDEIAQNGIPGLTTGYPLDRLEVAMGPGVSRTLDFSLGASTARYFRLSASGAHPATRIEFTTPSGARIPNGPRARAIVVRTR